MGIERNQKLFENDRLRFVKFVMRLHAFLFIFVAFEFHSKAKATLKKCMDWTWLKLKKSNIIFNL